MGGVVGHILYLFCRSGCQPSVVASALAFHPPSPPTYSMILTADQEPDVEHPRSSSLEIENSPDHEAMVADSQLHRTVTAVSQLKPGASLHTQFRLINELPKVTFPNVQAHLLRTRQRTVVPIFYFPVAGAKYTMIFSHGNAADIGVMFNTFEFMAKLLKINIVGYDYSGYGASFGTYPTEKQTYQDIVAVYEWCRQQGIVKKPEKEIILYGQSVGSGPTCYLARRQPVAGVILHSPFLSGLRVITPSRLLACFDIFPNIRDLPRATCPVFILHGQRDMEVGFAHGQQLYELLPGKFRYPPWWVPDRGHNDVLHGNEREFIRRVREFMEYLQRYGENVPVSAETTIASKTTYTTSTVSSAATAQVHDSKIHSNNNNSSSISSSSSVNAPPTGAASAPPTTPTSKVSASGVYAAVACHEPHDELAAVVAPASSSPLSGPQATTTIVAESS